MTSSRILFDPLIAATVVVVICFIVAQFWKSRSSVGHFVVQLLGFVTMTALLSAGGVVPYRETAGTALDQTSLLAAGLKFIWWLGIAWLGVGFLGAFVLMGREPRQSKLLHDLLAGLIYIAAVLAILSQVFNWPIKGLLATSGAVAVILGLALQSSLGDVFSGIVLNIERPYRVGDWIIFDDSVQGRVIEMNWRATRVMTGTEDVAIIPNSLVAKSKLVNCSVPTKTHGSGFRIKLQPTIPPSVACELLHEVFLGSSRVARHPPPSVTVLDIAAETMEIQLSYAIPDVAVASDAQNDLYDRIYRAVMAGGLRFAPSLAGPRASGEPDAAPSLEPSERILNGISLFASLTRDEKSRVAGEMTRHDYEAGDVIVEYGVILDALSIVRTGVLVGTRMENGNKIELARLSAGEYFGENSLLIGEPIYAEVTALTQASIYKIGKAVLVTLLEKRPNIADELSASLARRKRAMRAFDEAHVGNRDTEGSRSLADKIRRFFSMYTSTGSGGGFA